MSRFNDESFKQLQLNVKFNLIPKTRLKKFTQHFAGYKNGLMISEPGKLVVTPLYGQNAEKIYRLEPRKDDVWVITFPKCGTTWTSEMLWLVMNNFDTEKAKGIPLTTRAPFLEMPYLASSDVRPFATAQSFMNVVDKMPSPRVIKTHLPFNLLHPKVLDTSKVVYVARNPKDVIVSFYHHHTLIKAHDFKGNVEEFAQYFMDDEILYSPFFPHILDAWKIRDHPNMHFVFYEDMKKDLRGEIAKVCAFLGKSPTDEELTKMTEHLRFDNFEKNESVNMESIRHMGFMNPDGKFIRKGKTGDWKNHFSPEFNARLDSWIADNLSGSDIKFVTELEQQD